MKSVMEASFSLQVTVLVGSNVFASEGVESASYKDVGFDADFM